jgi:uncharacterized protein (TIGR00290 family)
MNNNNKQCICSWSGGKDSFYALLQAKALGYNPVVLLNMMQEEGAISRAHGIPKNILQQQAHNLNVPLMCVESSWQAYEQKFTTALATLKKTYNAQYVIFGDIDLIEHKQWEEKVCATVGLQPLHPLWLQNRKQVVTNIINDNTETIIVSCIEKLGHHYINKVLTHTLISELEEQGIDACGENGEYHTLVLNHPSFKERIKVTVDDIFLKNGYWMSTLSLV